jgi:hypothetical protein
VHSIFWRKFGKWKYKLFCLPQFLKSGGKMPESLRAAGLSDEARAQAQSLDTEAAWEAAQKKAADTGGIAVDFNPYDAETGWVH